MRYTNLLLTLTLTRTSIEDWKRGVFDVFVITYFTYYSFALDMTRAISASFLSLQQPQPDHYHIFSTRNLAVRTDRVQMDPLCDSHWNPLLCSRHTRWTRRFVCSRKSTCRQHPQHRHKTVKQTQSQPQHDRLYRVNDDRLRTHGSLDCFEGWRWLLETGQEGQLVKFSWQNLAYDPTSDIGLLLTAGHFAIWYIGGPVKSQTT